MFAKSCYMVGCRLSLLVAIQLTLGNMCSKAESVQEEDDRVCFFIVHDRDDSGGRRIVYALVAEADFAEPQLRRLSKQFREKYPGQDMLVFLYSRIEQLYAFSGSNPSTALGHLNIAKAPAPWNKYAGGLIIYFGTEETLQYHASDGELHKVELRK